MLARFLLIALPALPSTGVAGAADRDTAGIDAFIVGDLERFRQESSKHAVKPQLRVVHGQGQDRPSGRHQRVTIGDRAQS